MKQPAVFLLILAIFFVSPAYSETAATAPKSLFDPARHMRVSEVKPGMKGHGRSVFSGTKIETFEVEVISVMRNFNPKGDVILIKCKGANLEHTGSIAGMSGSPIYLADDSGKERMVGAFAYGWSLSKDPIAGVQPIEYMLEIPEPKKDAQGKLVDSGVHNEEVAQTWNLNSAINETSQLLSASSLPASGGSQLKPLVTPLMVSGMSDHMIQRFTPMFQKFGMVPMQAGGAGGSADESSETSKTMEPGSVLAVPLLTGDLDLSAIGTVTEVAGDRVFGFGHPFFSEGPISLPMGPGKVHTIIASLVTSFKLGSLTSVNGTLNGDQMVGVAGRMGESPRTVPIDLRLTYTDGSSDIPYKFKAALHPRLTPLICGMALQSTLSSNRDLPQYHTLEYNLNVEFANGETLAINNLSVNSNGNELFQEAVMPMISMSENAFERVLVKKVSGEIKVTPQARLGTILQGVMPKQKFRPGETAKGIITYRPFRSTEKTLPFSIDLPKDLAEGTYQLSVCDWDRNLDETRSTEPFKFNAKSANEIIKVLKDFSGFRRDALYVRLTRQMDGVAVGRTALPKLPSSRRQAMLSTGRSDVVPYASTKVKIIPTDLVLNGSADFTITIDKNLHVETPKPAASTPAAPAAPVAPKSEK